MRPPRINAPLIAPAALFVGVLTLLGPALRAPTQRMVGLEHSQVWRVLWSGDQALQQLLSGEAWPWSTTALVYPFGGDWVSASPLLDLVVGLMARLLGDGLAWNLLMMAGLMGAGMGAARLAERLGAGVGGALLAALSFGLHPFLLTTALCSGSIEAFAWSLFPWLIMAGLDMREQPTLPRAARLLGLGLLCLGVDVESWLGIVIALPPLIFLSPVQAPSSGFRDRAIGASWWGALAVLWLVLGLFVTWNMVPLLGSPITLRPPGLGPISLLVPSHEVPSTGHSMAQLEGYFKGGAHRLVLRDSSTEWVSTTYLGLVACGLALFGAGKGTLRWAVVSGVMALLATGPWMLLTFDSWRPLHLPWWSELRELLPPARMVSGWNRLAGWAALGVAVLASLGLRRLEGHIRLPEVGLGLAASLLLAFELALASPVPLPLPTTEVSPSRYLRPLRELEGGLINWPRLDPDGRWAITRHLADQRQHHLPLPDDLDGGTGRMKLETNPLLVALERITLLNGGIPMGEAPFDGLSAAEGREQLVGMGYRWVLLHPEQVHPERMSELRAWMDDNLSPVRSLEGGQLLYALDTAE